MLAVIETHPVQYRAPVYRMLHQKLGIPITVIYGSDYSVAGYQDREFNATFAWDIDLLSNYPSQFLSTVQDGGAQSFETVSAKGLRKVLQEVDPAAVLITGYNHRFYQSAFYQALRLKCPILLRAETTDHALTRSPFKAYLRDFILRWLYRQCYKTLYIGQHSQHHYERLGCSTEQLVFCPYCVDTTPFELTETERTKCRQRTRQQLKIDDTDIVLIFSGKLSPRKRPDLILQAVQQLPPLLRQRVNVLFMGDGELKSELQRESVKSLPVKTHFVGFQNQTELSYYYHAADILIMPSQYSETWGLVVNEGLHHGLLAIVSQAVGCAPDLVIPGVTGEIFETGSAQSLAQAIERSLPRVSHSETRQQCKVQVSKYSVEQAARGIAKAYSDIVSEFNHSSVGLLPL